MDLKFPDASATDAWIEENKQRKNIFVNAPLEVETKLSPKFEVFLNLSQLNLSCRLDKLWTT